MKKAPGKKAPGKKAPGKKARGGKAHAGKARFLWITDPWETLDHARDTSLRLAQECLALGHEAWWCDVHSIRWEPAGPRLDASPIQSIGPDRAEASIRLGVPRPMAPSEFTSLQFRTDPPIDLAYLHPLQVLALGVRGHPRSKIVNPPEILFGSNEKLEAILLGPLMPPSVASSQWEPLAAFGAREKRTVLKPLFEAQSKGIELLDWETDKGRSRAREAITAATYQFSRPVLLQRYLPAIRDGETRLWFIDGRFLAAVRKLPLEGDFRVNLDRGSRVVAAELTAVEKRASLKIGALLRKQGIRLAAVDLIEGYVTDFNFTSPGLIVQMEQVLGKNLARTIVQALAR